MRRSSRRSRSGAASIAVLAGWAATTAASAQFVVFDRESPTYGRYAIASSGRIKVGSGAGVEGSLHADRLVMLKRGSTVTGDAAAGETIQGHGHVLGRVLEGVSPLVLPELPDRAEARALASRVVEGPLVVAGERIDDVLFVSGPVRIEGPLLGMGTLIATGPVTLAPVPGSPHSAATPTSSDETRVSILTWSDLSLGPRSFLRGVARISGRAMLSEGAVFEGALLAGGDVDLGPRARVVFDRFGDTVAPSLVLLAPPSPVALDVPLLAFSVLYADTAPGVDLETLSVVLDGDEIVAHCSVGAAAAACRAPIAAAGERRLAASIRDLEGNPATVTLDLLVLLDLYAPELAIEAPADGALLGASSVAVAGSVSDDGVLEAVTVNGSAAAIDAGRFSSELTLPDGEHAIVVGARDTSGRETERVATVTIDTTAPRLEVHVPVAEEGRVATHRASIRVAGAAEDEHGVAAVEVAGVPAALSSGAFEAEVPLESGRNRVRIAAADTAGNLAALELEVDRVVVPAVIVLAPLDGDLVLGDSVDVFGTVDDPEAVVTVNGTPAAVSGTSFRLDGLPVTAGATLINVLATGRGGLVGTAGVTVLRDLEPPTVVVRHPAAGSIVHAPAVAVAGMVNDLVVGTVNSAQVEVTVNGEPAEVTNRSFLLEGVALTAGDNLILVEAVDPSGNLGRQTIAVRRQDPAGPTLAMVTGDGQSAVAGTELADPLVVVARDPLGIGVPGWVVTFEADGTDGGFEGGSRRQVAVTTGADGMARVRLTLGRRAGHHRVRASAIGFAGDAVFVARATPGDPTFLLVDSGDQQVGAAGRPLREPLAAVVTDSGFNRVESAVVRFEVAAGGGAFVDGGSELDVVTDGDGRASARLVLGPDEGVGNNVVRARLLPSDGGGGGSRDSAGHAPMATFAASALVAGEPEATSFSGVVLDNSDQPVPGATVSLEGSPLSVRTDAAGFFRLHPAPVGTMHLRVDGSTVERPGVWTSLEFLISTVAGRDNSMGRPIHVLPLETANALAVSETAGGVLTLSDVPGFALEVEPGSVTFPGGRRDGVVTVTTVHGDKVPMPPNFGQQPRFVITIAPPGARFDPPARVSFPNVDGLAPGQVTEMYSFDHDLARFVSIGPGTVSADGIRIVSDPGAGIVEAGWHAAGDPDRPATCHDCAECKSASGGACVADDAQTPAQKAPDDCRMEICSGGRAVSRPDSREMARQASGNCYQERCMEPRLVLDLGDAPGQRRCCGNAAINAPTGRLAGIYEPERECCIEDGRFVVDKGPPLDVEPELCPDRADAPEVSTDYDGCSGGPIADVYLHATGIYSGDRNNPTPGGEDGRFSAKGQGEVAEPPILPCDRHDDCYQTCDSRPGSRDGCDGRFREEMNAICAGLEGSVLVSDPGEADGRAEVPRSSVCMTFAETYYFGVRSLGGPAFTNGQREHCRCCA